LIAWGTRYRSRGVWAASLLCLALARCGGEAVEEPTDPRLQNPLLRASQFNETAPPSFQARFETTNGDFVIEVHREWAPLGADRFYNLVKRGWYDGVRFHRVVPDFMVQWGIHDDTYVNRIWQDKFLTDDPVEQTNRRGRVSFAKAGRHSRTVQVFINFKDNAGLDGNGFSPFGEVVEGMDVVDGLYSDYGDGPPVGEGVYQAMAMGRGAEYYDEEFPELDRITRATISAGGP
jgi:peptidyl-prolyl cis-trans isomerase A (cyclophilin A)